MISVEKNIKVHCPLVTGDNEINIDIATMYGTSYINNAPSSNNPNTLKIKNNDIILANLSIINTNNVCLNNLILKLNDNNMFKFINSSLINKLTKEHYICEYTDSNIFLLNTIKPNETLKLKFYIKSKFNNSNIRELKKSIQMLSLNNKENEILNSTLFTTKQAALMIRPNLNNNIIEIQNIGTAPSNNIIYRYEIPQGYSVDMSSIKYKLVNMNCNISAHKIRNNILFKIDSIPENNNLENKKIIISLTHNTANTNLYGANMSLI